MYIYTHTHILLTHKKGCNIATYCSNMDRPREYHTKWSQTEKAKCYISVVCESKNNTNESYTNEKQTHRYRKQANVTIKGGGKGIS